MSGSDKKRNRRVEEKGDKESPQKQPRSSVGSDLRSFYNRGRFGDVTFLLTPEPVEEKKRGAVSAVPPPRVEKDGFVHISAHRVVLAARSPVFEAMLYPCPSSDALPLPKQIEIKGVRPSVFHTLLEATYSGEMSFNPESISDLVRAAQRYQVEDVSRMCQDFLKKGITTTNACMWFMQAQPGSSERKSALMLIEDQCGKVVNTKGFLSLPKKDLQEILQSNFLNINEIDLFEAVVRWGEAELDRQGKEDTPENRRELLVSCLAYIRFPVMKLEEIVAKVAPGKLLPPDDLLQFYTYISAKSGAKPPFHLHYDTRPRNPRRPVSFFQFDPDQKHPAVTLLDDGMVAVNSASSSWQSVLGTLEMRPRTGIYEWTVTLETYNTTNSYNVLLGVAPSTGFDARTAATPAGYSAKGWTFITGQGQLASGTVALGFGANVRAQCKQGDRVGVRMDTDKATISFYKNGQALGLSIPSVTGTVRPVVSMVQNQRVRLSFHGGAGEE